MPGYNFYTNRCVIGYIFNKTNLRRFYIEKDNAKINYLKGSWRW